MSLPTLVAVSRTTGANAALKDGTVTSERLRLEFEEVPVLVDAFRRMVRGLEWDVCEMALTTYLCAREHGVAITALPIPIVRGLHHRAFQYHVGAGISSPKDLEGRRVGVNRGYTVTSGVWARAILQEEHGVDLDRITWVLSGDEHVASFVPPANVEPAGPDEDLEAALISGELTAAAGLDVRHPDVAPLIDDAYIAGLASVRERGLYPINHLIVVRDDLLAEQPSIAAELFDLFARSKAHYLDALRSGTVGEPNPADRLHLDIIGMGFDPLPYGIEPNRSILEQLIDHAMTQRILKKRPGVDALFAEGTRDLVA